ncbi:MAG: glycosyltransferase family 39 protein [Elusimicrobiota bacterium]
MAGLRPLAAGGLAFVLPPGELFTASFFGRCALWLGELTVFWLAAWGLGRPWLRWFPEFGPLERAVFGLALGAGALGLLALGLGLSLWCRPAPLRSILCALAGLGLFLALRRGPGPRLCFDELPPLVPAVVLSAATLVSFLYALIPATFHDALIYHLSLPDLYLRRGAIVPVPENVYAGIPGGASMLYLWGLALDKSGSLCQLLSWSCGLLTAAGVLAAGRRLKRPEAGLWGAAFFLVAPMTALESWRPGTELVWSLYLAAAMLSLLVYSESESRRLPLLAGVLAGLALGTKYPAVWILPASAVFFIGRPAGFNRWMVFAGAAVLMALPWGLKNLFFYANPVQPFLSGTLFAQPWPFDRASFMGASAVWPGLGAFARYGWHFTFPAVQGREDLFSPVLLMFLPLWALSSPGPPERRVALFGAALALPMALVSHVARFNLPATVPLSLAAALVAERSAWGRILAAGALCACGLFSYGVLDGGAFWSALKGPAEAREYLSQANPGYPYPPYAVFLWANEHLPPKAKVLLVAEHRRFYLERDSEASSPYATEPLVVYVRQSAGARDLRRRLEDKGITHLYVNRLRLETLRGAFTPPQRKLLGEFWTAYVREVFSQKAGGVFVTRDGALYGLGGEGRAPDFPF